MTEDGSSNLLVVLAVSTVGIALNSWINWALMLRQPCTWRGALAARCLGALFLLIPGILFYEGEWLPDNWLTWQAQVATLVLSIVGILFQKYRKQSEVDHRVYSYLYTAPAHSNFIAAEIFGWSVYLYAYELLFRGLMLHTTVQHFHWFTAFLASNTIYALAHIQQGRREMLGSFFAGWIFCTLAVWTGSFAIAFIIHLALALANSYFTVRETLAIADRSNSNSLGHVR
jgi:membrane protease YdiL (CAAX protease family)